MLLLSCFFPLTLWITLFKFSMLFLIALTVLYWTFPSLFMTSKYSIKWMYPIYFTNPLLLDIRLIPIFCSYKQFLNCPNILNKCTHLKDGNPKTTLPAVVWNSMESTLTLNFIFSLDFLFLESFFPTTKPFYPSKHSTRDPSLPSWLLIYRFFWNNFFFFINSISAYSLLCFHPLTVCAFGSDHT